MHNLTTNDMKRILTIIAIALLAVAGAEKAKAQESPLFRKGYSGNAELGVLAKEYPYGTLSTTHGYSFGNGWFIGAGASFQSGLYPRMYGAPEKRDPALNPDGSAVTDSPSSSSEQYEGGFLLGAHFDARYAFRNKRFTPFLEVKTGVTYDLHLEALGSFIEPSVGVAYGRFALSAGLNTHFGQKRKTECIIMPDVKFMPHITVAVHF